MGDINFTRINQSIGEPRPINIALDPRFPKVREEITFIAAGINVRGNYNWSFGDESFQQGANLTKCSHAYEKAGCYLVNLTTNDDKNRSRSNLSWIVVNDPPHAKIEWIPHLPNVKEKISFTGKGSTDDSPLETYIWHFGDGTNATGRDVSHVYDNGGSYLVSLRVMDEYNGTDDAQETIEVNSPPSAHFSYYPSSPTTEDDVSFDASLSSDPDPKSSIKAYEWDFGDKKKGSGLYPEHRYEKDGNFTVKLTVIDDNDLKDNTPPLVIRVQNKNVRHPPTAHINFAPEKYVTTEDDVIFDASWSSDVDGGGLKFEWDLDDGTRSNKSSFSHRFSKEGEHTVNLTVKDEDNLNNSLSRRLSVAKPKDPIAFFSCNPDILEAGKEITFNGTSSQGDVVSYRWDFGDKSPGKDGAVVNHTYSPKGFKAASYKVTLTVKDKREKENSSSKELTVEPARVEPMAPFFNFEPKNPAAGNEVAFNATSSKGSIKSYEWNYGDGSPIGTKAIENHTFPANESVEVTYQVILTLTDINEEKIRISKNISVSPPPPPPLQPHFTYEPHDPIVGQQVIFDATSSKGTVANYLWDFGDGSAPKDDAIVPHAFTASPKNSRTYDVNLTVTDKK
jgi:PKD repeat protein